MEDKNERTFFLAESLEVRDKMFQAIFEQSPIGIIIGMHGKIYDANPMAEKILGRSKKELLSVPWQYYAHMDDIQKDEVLLNRLRTGEIQNYSLEKRYIKPDGSVVWVNLTIAPLQVGNRSEMGYVCLIEDITQRVQAENERRESERSKSVLLSNMPGMAYRCKFDRDWTMLFVSDGCFDLTGYKPESLLNNKDICFNALIHPQYQESLWKKWQEVVRNRSKLKEEYEIITASGEIKWVFEQGQAVYDEDGEVIALEGLIIDITDKKMKEQEVEYLNNHDFLTGLYNRKFFELQKEKMDTAAHQPMTILLGDINGLKLVNDAFGHQAGDRLIMLAAKILKSCMRKNDILARYGGDEFSIILPNTNGDKAYDITKKIKRLCEEYNKTINNESFGISISLGYATKMNKDEDIDLIIRTAEDYMYKHKLLESTSSHSDIVSSIRATMFERSHETQHHADRLSKLSRDIGVHLNFTQAQLDDLELLATLHDIGKVGVDDRILNKPGKLEEKEWFEMKKHSEIGYRIAMASPELVPIAEYILYHHERWDGTGYPSGLEKEEIPLPSRILAVVDAYDAMTQDRVYRKAMSKEAAVEELRRNAGTQFDPVIIDIFIHKVLRIKEQNETA
jgi:diguanylate cyclase (GGDEF)-like protein/PAS domain S-box-containing protein